MRKYLSRLGPFKENTIVDRLVEEDGSATADGPVSEESSELHLPKVSYPLLRIPWGVMVLEKMGLCRCGGKVKWRRRMYQGIVLVLTFLVYMSFHLSRVAVGVVKSTLLPPCHHAQSDVKGVCSINTNYSNETCPEGWEPFVGHNGSSVDGATRLGGLDTAFLITYALTMFISGIIAERTPLRYFLSIGMLGATVCTSLLGFAFFWRVHYLWYFILVQIAGGMFQSTGWPALLAIMGNWFGKSRRGAIMGVWNWHASVGNLLGYVIPAFWATPGTWGWSFLSAAFIMLSINILFFLFLPSEPGVVGLKPLEQNSNDKKDENNPKPEQVGSPSQSSNHCDEAKHLIPNETSQSTTMEENTDQGALKKKAIPFCKALAIPGVVEYSVALFFSKLVSYTFLFWLPFYISNQRIGGKCLNPFESALFAGLFDIGAMIGSVLIGTVSDVIHSRSISCMLFFGLAVPALFVYRSFGYISMVVSGVLIVIVGVFVNGPYAIITTAVSADLGTHKKLKGEKKALATITAIIDGTGSIGGAVGPFLTGWIDDQFGWDSVFYFLMTSCFLATLLIMRIIILDIIKGLIFFRKKWRICQGELPENIPPENSHNSNPKN